MLEYVRRYAQVRAAVAHGKPVTVSEHSASRRTAPSQHLARVKLEKVAVRALRPELIGDVSGAAADIKHGPARYGDEPLKLASRVPRERRVKALGIGLLGEEQPEQAYRPQHAQTPLI